jgi:hypothetical protein
MKPTIPILFMLFICSCNPKKAEIVKKIELYQDSLDMAYTQNAGLAARVNQSVHPPSDKPADSVSARNDRKKDMEFLHSEEYRKMRDSAIRLKWRINQYQIQIESLNLELKKY